MKFVGGATNSQGKGPKNTNHRMKCHLGEKKELAGSSCIQRNDLASRHFAWAAQNYQDVQGNGRKWKEM
jgi:hypothetical protein